MGRYRVRDQVINARTSKQCATESLEQGLRILARIIAHCHVEKSADPQIENPRKSEVKHEGNGAPTA